jgi:hypothetical protein
MISIALIFFSINIIAQSKEAVIKTNGSKYTDGYMQGQYYMQYDLINDFEAAKSQTIKRLFLFNKSLYVETIIDFFRIGEINTWVKRFNEKCVSVSPLHWKDYESGLNLIITKVDDKTMSISSYSSQ